MRTLDNQTLFVLCELTTLIFAIFWTVHGLLFREKGATSVYIGLFNLFIALGLFTYSYRSTGNYFVGYYVSDLSFYIGILFAQIGLIDFFKKTIKPLLIITGICAVFQVVSRLVENNYLSALILSAYMAISILYLTMIVAKCLEISDKRTRGFILTPLIISFLFMAARLIALLLHPQNYAINLPSPGTLNTIAILSFLFCIIGINSTLLGVTLSALLIKVNKLAYIDVLTELPNRRFFQELFSKGSYSETPAYSLLLIDIDFFKKINDTLGHDTGDSFLKEFSSVIKATLSNSKFSKNSAIARLGGEEFGIVVPSVNLAEISELANSIHTEIRNNYWLTTLTSQPTVSIGIATMTNLISTSFVTVYKQADMALYTSKNTGRNKTTIFSN